MQVAMLPIRNAWLIFMRDSSTAVVFSDTRPTRNRYVQQRGRPVAVISWSCVHATSTRPAL
jgi:hypothetical protein